VSVTSVSLWHSRRFETCLFIDWDNISQCIPPCSRRLGLFFCVTASITALTCLVTLCTARWPPIPLLCPTAIAYSPWGTSLILFGLATTFNCCIPAGTKFDDLYVFAHLKRVADSIGVRSVDLCWYGALRLPVLHRLFWLVLSVSSGLPAHLRHWQRRLSRLYRHLLRQLYRELPAHLGSVALWFRLRSTLLVSRSGQMLLLILKQDCRLPLNWTCAFDALKDLC